MTSQTIKKQSSLILLAKSFKKYYLLFFVSVILTIASVVFTILTPSNIQGLTNVIANSIAASASGETVAINFSFENGIMYYAVRLILLLVFAFLSSFIAGFILNTIIQQYAMDLREQISEKINKLPLDYYDTTQIGDILSVITNDIDTLGTSLQNCVTLIIQSGTMLIGVIIAMFIARWDLAIVVMVSLPLMLIIIGITFKFAIPLFNKNQETLAEVNALVEENYSGHLVIKAFNSEDRKKAEFAGENNKFKNVLYRSQAIGGLIEPAMNLVSYLTYAAVLILAGILLMKGKIDNFGIITGFLIYISLFQEPLSQIGQTGSTIQLGVASSNRIFDFLTKQELSDESQKPTNLLDKANIRGEVEFCDVCFGYDPSKLTIKGFSEKIKPGMKVAIIGPTGAGKTTLVNLLMRFYDVTSGDIKVDGVSINEMTREELRKVFGMILQETWVINGSLRENIVYNLENVSEERLNEVLEKTNLSHFVSTLPQGIDTVIQKESALSAGQKQLITIARAMVENAPMLILDEATSNVDTRTEILIQNAMDELTKGRTSFVIAHRLSTIKNADLIIVMKDGNVVETGNHDSLMALGGLYSEIYNSQFN